MGSHQVHGDLHSVAGTDPTSILPAACSFSSTWKKPDPKKALVSRPAGGASHEKIDFAGADGCGKGPIARLARPEERGVHKYAAVTKAAA